MIIININENELSYFNDIIKNNPENTDAAPLRGFDGANFYQIIFDASIALSTQFLTALGLYLNYKVSKKQLEFKQQELNSNDNDSDNDNNEQDKFELKILSPSKKYIYSSDNLDEKKVNEIIEKITDILKS